MIPFCSISVDSTGVRSLEECSGRSLHPPGKSVIDPTYSSVTVRVRRLVPGNCWNRSRNAARTDLWSTELNHTGRALGKGGDSHSFLY